MLSPKFSTPKMIAALSAAPRGSGMRAARHQTRSSTDASTRRTALAHTGASASLPRLMTRNVLPQIAEQPANASHTREPDSGAGGFAPGSVTAARHPRRDALRDLVGREPEMLLELRERRRLAKAIDPDREPARHDEPLPVVGRAGFDRDAASTRRQHRVTPRAILRQEDLRRGHAHHAH